MLSYKDCLNRVASLVFPDALRFLVTVSMKITVGSASGTISSGKVKFVMSLRIHV